MASIKPYQERTDSKKQQIEEMFDKVSSQYDFLNRILSFGVDIGWRNKVVQTVEKANPKKVLDVATGTGDLAIAMAKKIENAHISGFDLSSGMLAKGQEKIDKIGLQKQIDMIHGDAENMPFAENAFDAVTVSFGVRNFENLALGIKEIHRVLSSGGKLIILEFSQPQTFPVKQLYAFYSKYVLPNIGRLISEDKEAYDYLPNSIQAFPFGKQMTDLLEECGFLNASFKKLHFGIASIYIGTK